MTAYLIARVGLEVGWDGHWGRYVVDAVEDRPRLQPEAVFPDRASAEADLRRRLYLLRRSLNPMASYTGLRWATTLPVEDCRQRLTALGVPPPRSRDSEDWVRWWDEAVVPLPEDAFSAAWDLLDRIELYRLVEIDLED